MIVIVIPLVVPLHHCRVNNTIFALCRAIRVLNLHNSDGELNYTRSVIPFHGEAYAKSVEMLLCAQ